MERTCNVVLACMAIFFVCGIVNCKDKSRGGSVDEELVCTDGVDNDDDGLTDCDDPDCSQEDICQPAPFTVVDVEVTGDSIDGPQDRTYGGQLNGIVDAGETVFLSPQIRNDSGRTFISLSAQLRSTDPEVYVEPLESFQDYDDIIDGATDRPNLPYVVTFSPEIPDGTLVTFNMALVDSVEGDVGRVTFTVAVRNVAVTGESYVYDDDDIGASSGNGDGRVDPDEQIELRCDILNSGGADLPLVTVPGDQTLLPLLPDNIIVEIESASPHITILNLDNPPTYNENIPAGASASTPADFDFVVSPQAPSGEIVCISLKIRLVSGGADVYTFRDLTCFLISGATGINECRDDQDCVDSDPETVDTCDLETGMCLNIRLCGNGVIDPGEECDGGLLAGQDCNSLTGHSQGTLGCSQTCQFDTWGCHTCGDGTAQGPELCDGGDLGGATCATQAGHTDGNLQCNVDCMSFDTSGCYTCGDGAIDGPEVCDGQNVGGETCSSQTTYTQGNLDCMTDCLFFDMSDCHTCGNGTTEGGEGCDDGNTQNGDGCNSNCQQEYCGDGTVQSGLGEECDDGNTQDGDGCNSSCQQEFCGDGVRQGGLGEECDGTSLGGQTCSSLTGHTQGILSCNANCTYNTSDCHTCSNGSIEGPEQCDGGNLGGQSCSSLTGHTQGTLACSGACTFDIGDCHTCGNNSVEGPEECDGANLNGQNCSSVAGHSSGVLACNAGCAFDMSGCYTCGNGSVEGPEVCDGANLNGQTCFSVAGHPDGVLACVGGCLSFDVSGCHTCGNGAIEGPESCDGANLGGQNCASVTGHTQGNLACLGDCTFDSADCHTCGNNSIDGPETCDGTDFGAQTCATLTGHLHGGLTCAGDCSSVGVSNCYTCGNGSVEGPEVCDDGNSNLSDSCPDGIEGACGPASCGDGFVWDTDGGTEVCDDGNGNTNDACPDGPAGSCQYASCGDGYVWDTDGGAEECDDGNSLDWDGCNNCAIAEFQVNSHTTGAQQWASVSMFPDRGFVVVWTSWNQDGDGGGIYGQRFDTAGAAVGPEFKINSYTTQNQIDPSVATWPDGRFVVVWESYGQDGDGMGVFGQRIDTTGNPEGAEFQINTYTIGDQRHSDVATSQDGFAVVWTSYVQDGDGSSGIYGQRFGTSGNPDGPEFKANSYTQDTQTTPRVAMASDGRFVVVWMSNNQDGAGYGIYARPFDSAGPVGAEFRVNSYWWNSQTWPAVSMTADGAFVVVWISAGQVTPTSSGVYGQRYDATGLPIGGEFEIVTYDQPGPGLFPQVAESANGNFVVTWQGWDASQNGIEGRRFDSLGNPVGPVFQANTFTQNGQIEPQVAIDPDGDCYVVVWRSDGQDGDNYGIFAQRYNVAGDPRGVLPW